MLLETGLEVGNRLGGPVQIELATEGHLGDAAADIAAPDKSDLATVELLEKLAAARFYLGATSALSTELAIFQFKTEIHRLTKDDL